MRFMRSTQVPSDAARAARLPKGPRRIAKLAKLVVIAVALLGGPFISGGPGTVSRVSAAGGGSGGCVAVPGNVTYVHDPTGQLIAAVDPNGNAAVYNYDPVGNLKASLQAYVEFGLRHPHHYQLTFMTRPAAGGEGRRQIGLEAFNCMRAGVRACVEHGKFRTDDVELASQVLWTAVHGLTSLLITYSRFPWVPQEKLISEAIESAVRGMER